MFCASIGVVSPVTQEILVGVIYNPALDEMTTAIQNQGCHLNGQLLLDHTKNQEELSEPSKHDGFTLDKSVINIGFPVVQKSTLLVSSRAITALCTKVRGVRMIACASQVMAWVAQGKLQAYVSWDLNAWDIAAGILIVREAGGNVCDMSKYGSDDSGDSEATVETRDMVASCVGGLNMRNELLHVLKENDCLTY